MEFHPIPLMEILRTMMNPWLMFCMVMVSLATSLVLLTVLVFKGKLR